MSSPTTTNSSPDHSGSNSSAYSQHASTTSTSRLAHLTTMTSSSHPSQVSSFTVIQLNTRSLIPRADELRLLVSSHPADVIAIQESWLSNNNIAPDLRGYIWYGVNRQSAAAGGGASGGGVGFYVRDSLSFCVVPVQNFSVIEFAVISLQAIDASTSHPSICPQPPKRGS